jgi:telomere length regulation protein
MLAAEIIAQRVDKKLNFGDWDGDDMGKPWARKIRLLIAARDVDGDIGIEDDAEEERAHLIDEAEAVGETEEISTEGASYHTKNRMAAKLKTVSLNVKAGYDSDDSLTGYTSPSSSRSVSPTPSELEEFEQDPTVRVGIKKIPRPVYLAQLGELVRSTSGVKSSDDNQEVDKIEMALSCGEELIRKKQDYGVELGMSQAKR